jgi:hypothetical protein
MHCQALREKLTPDISPAGQRLHRKTPKGRKKRQALLVVGRIERGPALLYSDSGGFSLVGA